MTWRVSVVLPELSGPKTSTTRPRGMPPTPSAMSRVSAPVGMISTRWVWTSPRRMIAPLPWLRSIWLRAVERARSRSVVTASASVVAADRRPVTSIVRSMVLLCCVLVTA